MKNITQWDCSTVSDSKLIDILLDSKILEKTKKKFIKSIIKYRNRKL